MFACVAFVAAFGGGKIPEGRAETPAGVVRVSSAWCCLPRPSAVTPLAVLGLLSLVYGVSQIVTGV
jgi:hypothetical protein